MSTNEATTPTPAPHLPPPVAERRPHELVAHGDRRVDDWYWLRDKDDPAVLAHLEAENAYYEAATAHLAPLAGAVYEEIVARVQLTDVSWPVPQGAYAYYRRTVEGLQHSIYCRRPVGAPLPAGATGALERTLPGSDLPDPHEVVLLDQNLLAEGHEYFQVGETALSPDKRLLAYGADLTGGELMTVRIRDLDRGVELDDVIEGAYYGLAFSADNSTLFYVRADETLRPYQVWRHRLGRPVAEDELVWQEDDERFFLGVGATKDDRLLLFGSESSRTSEWRYLSADDPAGTPVLVTERREGVLYAVEHHDGELVITCNDEGENFGIYRAPLGSTDRAAWEVVLAPRADVLVEEVDVVAGHLLVEERGHATTAVRILPLDGGDERVIEAPEAGCCFLAGNAEFDTTAVRYETTTLIWPRELHELDLATGEHRLLRRQPVRGYDPADYRTARTSVRSADGTEVPVTLAWRADRPAGPGPCYLYGYGAYGASMDPAFRTDRGLLSLLDRGVTYVLAHVRGGSENGRGWYLDGKLEHKHHTFEDFLAVAHHLVAAGHTTAGQLAAGGASAGGLLVGATVNLDPGAFGAIVAEVPFVDCLTTMLDPSLPLTTNEWEEWGDPVTDRAAYECIKAYSPYDNVQPERYPRLLVTGGLNDPRVSFFEPPKWVQRLRAAHPDNASRVLLRMELVAGHFGPSGRYDYWQKNAEVLAFALDAIGAATSPA